MRLDHALGQAGCVHGEPVVHRRDFNLAGVVVFNRVVGAMVAVVHLDGARAKCQREHLVTKADTKHRYVCCIEDRFDHRYGVFTRRRRIARTVRQKYPVRIMRKHVLCRGCGWQHGDFTTGRREASQNVSFGTVVDGDHFVTRACLGEDIRQAKPNAFRPICSFVRR